MKHTLLLLFVSIIILLIILGLVVRSNTFVDYKDSHSNFTERQLSHYGSVPSAVIGSKNYGALGTSANLMIKTPGFKGNYPADSNDGFWKIIEKCESVKTMDCNAFDDPLFSLNCGICLDIGKNHNNAPSIGGLVLLPSDKESARTNRQSNLIPNYIPTLGFCPAGKMVSTKKECLKLQRELLCKKNSTYELPGCSQCYSDTKYSIVDPETSPGLIVGYGRIFLVGIGQLKIIEEGFPPGYDVTLSESRPFSFDVNAKEGKHIKFIVNPPKNPVNKNPLIPYLGGYITGRTMNGEWTEDLRQLIRIDEVTERKPRSYGLAKLDKNDITKMAPGFGKTTMTLNALIPFTFVDTTTQEASECKDSPFVTSQASAEFLKSDPCYNRDSGPGRYSQDCLQSTWITNGCTTSGTEYPNILKKNIDLMTADDGSFRSINDISNYIYNLAIITATGSDENGEKKGIIDWSNASMACKGIMITSPCDLPTNVSGTVSPDCIVYLWNNEGSNRLWNGQTNPIGPTYHVSDAVSLFKERSTLRSCQASGTLSPVTPDGSIKNEIIAYWQSKGSIQSIKQLMADLHRAANAQLVADDQLSPYFTQCYGDIKIAIPKPYVPPPPTPPPPPPSLLCLSHHWSKNPPHILMTANGKDWYIPNVPIKAPSTRVWIAKLRDRFYMACMYESQMLYSSTDSKNWTPTGPDIFKDTSAVGLIVYRNRLYLPIYDKGLFYTNDGINWTHVDIYVSHLQEMKIINEKLYFVNRYSISHFDETNNTSTQISPNFRGGNASVNHLGYDFYAKTYLICCSLPDQGDPQAELFYWSNDLVNWSPSKGNWRTGKYSGFINLINAFGIWWATGHDSSLLVCSEDGGKTWNEVTAPAQSHGSLFFYRNKLTYWGVDDPANQLYSTIDGITWKQDKTLNSLMNGEFLYRSSVA
jgi:hypothetical protein